MFAVDYNSQIQPIFNNNCGNCHLGNSSSGLIEVPFFNIPTINLGDRQEGRYLEKTVINCKINANLIIKSINKVYKNKKKYHKSYSLSTKSTKSTSTRNCLR